MINSPLNQQPSEPFVDFVRGTRAEFIESEPEPITWLWPDHIPFCALTLLEGAPGVGKPLFVSDLISRVTSAQPFPDGSLCEAGRVLIVMADGIVQLYTHPQLDAVRRILIKLPICNSFAQLRKRFLMLMRLLSLRLALASLT